MKLQTLTSLLLATATLSWAVPSEINYQGRLTDANGDAVTGDVSMSLKMFDAATEGNEIYSEDIGTVTLDDNGIYSFEFGAGGQSVVSTSELIATTDGSNQVFNATLENLPVDGSVSISDGTYTWSQANGSSSSTEFSASVTPSSGAVSAIYLGSAPTSSVDITASYNYSDTTLSGALSSHATHWLELSVDGTAQSPRERVLSVPFAQVASQSLSAAEIAIKTNTRIHIRSAFYLEQSGSSSAPSKSILTFPYSYVAGGQNYSGGVTLRIPLDAQRISKIHQIKANVFNNSGLYNDGFNAPTERSFGSSTIKLYRVDETGSILLASQSLDRVSGDVTIDHVLDLSKSFEYYIDVILSVQQVGSNWIMGGTMSGINAIEIACDSR